MTTTGLGAGLRRRHISMIAIGTSVGAGLFVGSGAVIHAAGPAAVLSYVIAGGLVLLTMRMLGEMVVSRGAGTFADYARAGLGDAGGFVIGWLYWYMYVILVAAEATAGAAILAGWLPIPPWLLSLGLLVLFTGINLFSVRWFGESEFWFSGMKVAAIVAFMALAAAWVLGLWPGRSFDLGTLSAHGGFMPNGFGAVVAAIVVVIFAFGGTETVTIAAGETAEPGHAVARAATGVLWRVALFYVGSIFLVVCVLPWDSAKILESPYVAALTVMGLPAVGTIMNVIILIAVLSVLNAALYVSSRTLLALCRAGDAPRGLAVLTGRKVPARALLLGTVAGLISAAFFYVSPDGVFLFLISSIGAILLVLFISMAVAQVRLRAAMTEPPALPMWGHPYLSWLAIAAYAVVFAAMAFRDETRPQLLGTLAVLAVLVLLYGLRAAYRSRAALHDPPSRYP